MAPQTNILDHILHLSPPGKLSEAITHWEQLGFKVIPGGTHDTGLSSNALVPLADGVYIELIALEKPTAEPPESESWWANKRPGWITWVCLGLEDHIDEIIAKREKEFNSGVEYQKGYDGGRKGENDGRQLRWRVTRRQYGLDIVPFFCLDLTPRDWRVPAADLDTHANTAVGIAYFHLMVPQAQLDQARVQLSVVLDSQPNESDEWEMVALESF
ncbi:unnamed protein product [Rhizoctonia solani]|uniref:Glyoxalase-like domain-containing protein n=1 Tax=Rhizoctonia solani TaxID=456999 RepID=A0A8H2X7E8_9AGAM|nr:unnamed protein product [Rhizoctonia solani]